MSSSDIDVNAVNKRRREQKSKVCSKCRKDLPLDCFYLRYDRLSGPGFYSHCKGCRKETQLRYRAETNREPGGKVKK